MLAWLDHAQLVKAALDKIFRTYVRGNAVHAHTKSGAHVTLDGRHLGYDEFKMLCNAGSPAPVRPRDERTRHTCIGSYSWSQKV